MITKGNVTFVNEIVWRSYASDDTETRKSTPLSLYITIANNFAAANADAIERRQRLQARREVEHQRQREQLALFGEPA